MKKRMKKLIRWLMVIMIPIAIMHNWEHFTPFTRLTLVASLFVFIPLTFYILSVVIEKKTKEITSEQKREEKKTLEEQIDKIYLQERMQYYQDCWYLFNKLVRAKKLTRSDILKIKGMIVSALGNYKQEYQYEKFQNDIHAIYKMMKNHHIDEKDWKEILDFLTLKAS